MQSSDRDILLKKISELEDESITLMKDLIAINAVGPTNNGPGEAEIALYLNAYLDKTGFSKIYNYPSPDPRVADGERPNIVTLIEGKTGIRLYGFYLIRILFRLGIYPSGRRIPLHPLLKMERSLVGEVRIITRVPYHP